MSTATVPATTPPKKQDIRSLLRSDSIIAEIQKAMPKHMTGERMARVALTCLTRTPKLATCTPESFMRCVLDLSAWGLEPDGRHAHLIPYGNECTLIIDYKGLVELAWRSGKVKHIHSDVVYAGDLFVYSLGEIKEHTPWDFRHDADKPKEKGKPIAAYSMVMLDGDFRKCEVMTYSEIEAIRTRSRAGQSGPWKTDWNEMAKKTAFRRVSKWIPLSAEVHEAFSRDDDQLPSISQQSQRAVVTDNRLSEILGHEEVADESQEHAEQGQQ